MVWVPLGEYTLEKFKNLRTAAEFAIDQIRVEEEAK
jgi:hypothetical protein